jgi:SPIN90/Ldb17, leucine-rich domain
MQVALNEQFMVSALHMNKDDMKKDKPKTDNRVIQILMRRLGSSKTFGENLIFMLNRAGACGPIRLVVCLTFARRSLCGRPVHAAPRIEDPLSPLYYRRNTGIFLHKRSSCAGGCVHSGTG